MEVRHAAKLQQLKCTLFCAAFNQLQTKPQLSTDSPNRLYGGMNYRRLGGGVGVIKMTHCESHIW